MSVGGQGVVCAARRPLSPKRGRCRVARRVGELAEQLCEEIARFEPGLYSGPDCAVLAEVLSKAEKALPGPGP